MKQVWPVLLVALLSVGSALLLYFHFIVKPGEATPAEQAGDGLATAGRQATRGPAAVDASATPTAERADVAFTVQGGDEDKRRIATDALAQTQRYKVALTEYFVSTGTWPSQAADAGLPRQPVEAGGGILISVGGSGTITVTFDENFASGTRLQLVPQAEAQTGQVHWQCTAWGDADLKRYLPDCSGS